MYPVRIAKERWLPEDLPHRLCAVVFLNLQRLWYLSLFSYSGQYNTPTPPMVADLYS